MAYETLPLDNSTNHAGYTLRRQPGPREARIDVLLGHALTLIGELRDAGGDKQLARRLHDVIGGLNEDLAEAYLTRAGVPPGSHMAACAINQAPAYRPGPCDCGSLQGTGKVPDGEPN